jgi:hypothetical protein
MANDCSNYIRISGSVENMKPIYDFFNEGQKKVDLYYTQKKEYLKEHPDKNMWDNIDGIELEEQLVMNTLIRFNLIPSTILLPVLLVVMEIISVYPLI